MTTFDGRRYDSSGGYEIPAMTPRQCVGRADTSDTWNRCQYHIADWVLWHKGWKSLLASQVCGTNPCSGGAGCDGRAVDGCEDPPFDGYEWAGYDYKAAKLDEMFPDTRPCAVEGGA